MVGVDDRCMMIARFQPLHYGHFNVIKYCYEKFKEVIIIVGMASQSHTPENPFTAGERIEMIRETIKWAKLPLDKLITVTLPTLEVSRAAVHYVKLYSPPFKYVVTLNPIIQRIFIEEGYHVIQPPIVERGNYRGTVIRKLIANGSDEWKKLVPPPVAEIIERIDGINRIRMLYKEKLPGYYVTV
ncbi:cytidyltransferase-related domain [Staphylothermus marinus F1]|uniref:Nicotinamide-nucleotide adenylyltransferase n=1 Tax=Staphylothermus marinus (strain ATCC 43588 / DSM 3639 / JCM 9404 / F1) TaxID=399550 RepID=A3DPL7_STAMF|nr:nicotinamide-nucleotide adenylyltransferase [Staphylothermus marinus]ABN70577.1 cytidyltransferase-related domain [Staphylothermus marinus F1]